MRRISIISALFDEATKTFHVVKEEQQEDGSISLNLHTFGAEALEWKAAELGIEDINLLIDTIIYEPYASSSDEGAMHEKATKIKQKLNKDGPRTQSTKNYMKSTLEVSGVDQKYIDAVDSDPYELISSKCLFDKNKIAEKRNYLSKQVNAEVSKPDRSLDLITKMESQRRARLESKIKSKGDNPKSGLMDVVRLKDNKRVVEK